MLRPPSMTAAASAGFTIIELLVAAVIFVIVTTLAGVFLVQQTTYTQRTQAVSDTQANLRLAMEMMTADLFNAGSEGVALPCNLGLSDTLLPPHALSVLQGTGTGASEYRDEVSELRYCSPYGDGAVNATYSIALDGGVPTLFRAGAAAIPGIVALDVVLECATGTLPDCVNAGDQPVFATVRMIARSVDPLRGSSVSSVEFGGVSLAELRSADVVQDGFFYVSSERRVVLPNFGR